MIPSNQLKIGNWVNATYDEVDYRRVASILGLPEFAAEPIPLTSEILQKAGFKDLGNYFEGSKDFKFKDGVLFNRHFLAFNEFNESKISFVHQLQNLYFSLTGEELVLNL